MERTEQVSKPRGCFLSFVVIVLAIVTAFFLLVGSGVALFHYKGDLQREKRAKAQQHYSLINKQHTDVEIMKSTPFN